MFTCNSNFINRITTAFLMLVLLMASVGEVKAQYDFILTTQTGERVTAAILSKAKLRTCATPDRPIALTVTCPPGTWSQLNWLPYSAANNTTYGFGGGSFSGSGPHSMTITSSDLWANGRVFQCLGYNGYIGNPAVNVEINVCAAPVPVTVTSGTSQVLTTATGTFTACTQSGNSISLSAACPASAAYSVWTDGVTSLSGTSFSATLGIPYSVSCLDDLGQVTGVTQFSIVGTCAPVIVSSTGQQGRSYTACEPVSLTASCSTGSLPSWNSGTAGAAPYVVSTPGVYTVACVNGNYISPAVEFTVTQGICTITVAGPNNQTGNEFRFCMPDALTASCSSQGSITWTPGNINSNTLPLTSGGNYTITCTNQGFVYSKQITVILDCSPVLSDNYGNTGSTLGVCANNPSTITAVCPAGMIAIWNNNTALTGGNYNVSQPGTYTVGCSDSNPLAVKGLPSVFTVVGISCPEPCTLPPSISGITVSGILGPDNCSVNITGSGTGKSFIFTGPAGYIFSNTHKDCQLNASVRATGITVPGEYVVTVNGYGMLPAPEPKTSNNSPQATIRVTVYGIACKP